MKKTAQLVLALMLSLAMVLITALPTFAAESTYTVQSGDTMAKIARANGITVQELKNANPNIKNINKIRIGQILNILGIGVNKSLPKEDKALLKSMFDAKFYAKQNPDVVKVYGDSADRLFEHFLEYGLWETREPNMDFNVNAYASAYGDLHKAFGDNVMAYYRHYDEYGKTEGRELTTIDKALTVVDMIKSVSPLNKVGSKEKVYDTIVAEKDTSGSTSEMNLWAKGIIDSYKDALISFSEYLDSIDGSTRSIDVESALNSDENKPGTGKYARALALAADTIIGDVEALKSGYPERADEIQDKLDAFKNVNKDITTDYIQAKISSYPEGLAFYNWTVANQPVKQAFKDAYENAHIAWENSIKEQNFTYAGQIIDEKTGVYGAASVDIYISNEKAIWESEEPQLATYTAKWDALYDEAVYEHGEEGPTWPVEYPYGEGGDYESEAAALAAYESDYLAWVEKAPVRSTYDNSALSEYDSAHLEWENAEPKAEYYFIAGFEDETTMLAAKEAWFSNNPEPVDNSEDLYEAAGEAFKTENFNRIKALGDYVFELISMYSSRKK